MRANRGKEGAARLIGRQSEYDRFAECMQKARKGLPTVLLFEGEPGSGKTSLLNALLESPLIVGRNVVALRLNAGAEPGVDIVARTSAMLERPELYARVGGRRRARELLSKLLPEWIGAIPILGDVLEATTVTAQALVRRRGPARTETAPEDIAVLHRLAARRPVALLVDDLHTVTSASADRLLRMVRSAEAGTRLLVVATVRTPAPAGTRSVTRVLQDGLPPERLVRHQLSPFSAAELDQWLEARFSAEIPNEVAAFLLAGTGGQPAAILELLDRLLGSGALRKGSAGWEYDEALAEMQLDWGEAADAYLAGLDEQTALIVKAATVFGEEFDALALARLIQMDELELEDRLAVAVRRGLLLIAGESDQPDGDVTTRYRFGSPSGRAALHRSLPAAHRRDLQTRLVAAR